ncbi:MAG: DNA polymerase III subunit tau [Alphaproteobacteria bacterium MarineAlpha5_Bin12]|nr:MAG: DNA polymerase III subunit tau [Alphaproteobacteria bacterium MarineAlpha5_Bin12]|tara:strand:+ start:1849 stop:3543 length:1695 start_codon:yes stop_codon:yes gene_type:complete
MDTNNYQVLARKYRPKKFSELIGQETLISVITNAIKLNRLAHAYLLTGIRGVGKTTAARLIARTINCEKLTSNNYEPCGNCDSCISILEEKNMDVIEMDAASRTGVDDVREIIENVKYKPTNCKFKIYIIDEVHMLSKNAFNALLKTLEEPPPHIKFLFATTEVQKIPVTILSRCQRFDLFRVNNEKLIEHILQIAEKEKILISKDAVALLVRAADGSVRDAISLLDQSKNNSTEKIESDDIVKMLGLADRGKIYDLIDLIFKGMGQESLTLFKSLYSQGADCLIVFEEMLRITHFLSEIKILPSILEDPYIPELEKNKGSEMSLNLTISTLGRFWQALFRGHQDLKQSSFPLQTAEMIIIRLIHLSNVPPPSELIKEIKKVDQNYAKDQIIKKNEDNISNKTVQKNHDILNNSESDREDITKKNEEKKIRSYREFVEMFKKYREPILFTKLYNNVKKISFEEGKVVLNFEDVDDENFARQIKTLISKWTGRIWNVILSDNKTGKTLAEEDVIRKQKLLEEINNYPEIKKILSTFPGSNIHSIEKEGNSDNQKNKMKILKQEKK